MNAKKVLAVLSVAATVAAVADVQALYWQVTPESNVNNVSFTAAALGYDDGAGHTGYLHNGSTSGNEWIAAASDGKSTELAAAILGEAGADYSGWSFFIELQNYDSTKGWYTSGRSETYAYSAISASSFSTSSSLSTVAPTTWSPSVPVPEPTSGLLMLVGGALLALRRRRV